MTHAETLIIPEIARCRFAPATFAKKFTWSMVGLLKPNATLSPKQRQTLWQIAHTYRKQIKNKAGKWTLEMIEAHIAALNEGDKIPHPEQKRFELALSLNPADWDTRLIFADWLEEHGDAARAAGMRWQATNQRHPLLCSMEGDPIRIASGAWQWIWHPASSDDLHVNSVTPELWPAMRDTQPSRIKAETAFADALEKLK